MSTTLDKNIQQPQSDNTCRVWTTASYIQGTPQPSLLYRTKTERERERERVELHSHRLLPTSILIFSPRQPQPQP
ncbi:hypothetical protein RIF29_07726 [Crotalaria pallida]|uniref:Uncharacterized protein n=1 Tax=Crotalaria pallida TaxID=3830 RepID=A0AAN9J616_CROPI